MVRGLLPSIGAACAVWFSLAVSAPHARAQVASPAPSLGAPTPGPTPSPTPSAAAGPRREAAWGIGLRSGYTTIPNFILGSLFDKYKPVNGWFIEAVASRRIKGLTLLLSMTGTFASADKGVWQRGPTKTPNDVAIDLGLWSADAVFDYEVRLHSRFALHFGAGIGLGALFGTISSTECAFVMIGNVQTCRTDPNQPPRDRKAEDSWPLYPILHVVAGARVDLWDRLSLRIDFDFRNAFGLGVGLFWEL